jgi:hypothetical protein
MFALLMLHICLRPVLTHPLTVTAYKSWFIYCVKTYTHKIHTSEQLMGAVLDELFTERPLALLVLEFDFIFLFCLLTLLIRATWQVQHNGPLKYDEILVMLALTFFNFLYIIREYINYVAKKKLGLSAQIRPLDLLIMISLFSIVGMSMNNVRADDFLLFLLLL